MIRLTGGKRWSPARAKHPPWWRYPQLLVVLPLVAVAAALVPLGGQSLTRIPALLPAMLTMGLAADATTFAVLMRLYRRDRPSPRLLGIAGCFTFSALMEVAFILLFPGVLETPGLLIAPAGTVVWVWTAWHGGMIVGLFAALSLSDAAWESVATAESAGPTWIAPAFWAVVLPAGLAAACLRLAEVVARLAPPALHGPSYAGFGQAVPGVFVVAAVAIALTAARRLKSASSLERWAMASAVVATAAMGLGVSAGSRYSLGWDAAWVLWAMSGAWLALVILFELARKLEARHLGTDRCRRLIAERLGRLDPEEPLSQLASTVCGELVQIPNIDSAVLVRLDRLGASVPLVAGADGGTGLAPAASTLPRLRGRDLKARTASGAFVEIVDPDDETDAQVRHYLTTLRASGVRAMAHAPIQVGGRIFGVVSVSRAAGTDHEAAGELTAALPILTDVAAITSILLAPAVRSDRLTAHTRREVSTILSRRSFRPVFQPIMSADLSQRVGHEALTRFDNGVSPDLVFRSAITVGLDAELEFACLRAAISEARGLGAPDTWLSLNLSPAVLVSSAEDLALALSEVDRPVVLELTEHMVIDGYGPVREALQRLGPDVKLAVDDAGSGFASLRHILELRPDFVKLDTSLVRDVHLDPVRQAMIAGLASFASRTKCHLIAEGVESEAELQELRSLGIPYVQGFLVGRPVPAPVRDSEIIRLAPHSERRRAGQAAKIG